MSCVISFSKELNYFSFNPQFRWLPGSKQFQLPKNPHDPYPQLYLLLERGELLASLSALLGTGGAVQSGAVMGEATALLEALMEKAHGITFLASHPHYTSTIIRSLLLVRVIK